MENLTLEECLAHFKKLEEICICLVCHGPLRATDIIVCTRGHAVCGSCRKVNSSCALCRATYSQNKPTLLCQMVEALPQFCRYEGCKKIMRENDMHEALCMFRLVACNVCYSTVEFKKFLLHLSDVHNRYPYGMEAAVDMKRVGFYCDKWLIHTTATTKLLNGHIFNINYFFRDKKLLVHIVYLPIRNVANSTYSIKLEMWSVDKKVNLTFSQEVNMKPNEDTQVFNVADNILKSFDGRDVNFKTTISSNEVVATSDSTTPVSTLVAATTSSDPTTTISSPVTATTFSGPNSPISTQVAGTTFSDPTNLISTPVATTTFSDPTNLISTPVATTTFSDPTNLISTPVATTTFSDPTNLISTPVATTTFSGPTTTATPISSSTPTTPIISSVTTSCPPTPIPTLVGAYQEIASTSDPSSTHAPWRQNLSSSTLKRFKRGGRNK